MFILCLKNKFRASKIIVRGTVRSSAKRFFLLSIANPSLTVLPFFYLYSLFLLLLSLPQNGFSANVHYHILAYKSILGGCWRSFLSKRSVFWREEAELGRRTENGTLLE